MRKLAVVDLDGTYLRANSLHIYIRLGMAQLLRRGHCLKAMRLAACLCSRRLHLTSHAAMKCAASGIIGWNDDLKHRMATVCSRHTDERVQSMIARWQAEGCDIVIATAAFEFYATAIVPYTVVGTTRSDAAALRECRGIVKADRVKFLADQRGATLQAVITDNLDDAPLLSLPFIHKYVIKAPTKGPQPFP